MLGSPSPDDDTPTGGATKPADHTRIDHSTEVRLRLPADPVMLRVARLTAAGLGHRLGFSYDEIEDVKIAVDELSFALVGPRGRPGSLELTFRLDPGVLTVDGVGRFEDSRQPRTSELSARILDAVVDEHRVGTDGDVSTFQLVKRGGNPA